MDPDIKMLAAAVAGKRVVPPVPGGREVVLEGADAPGSCARRDGTSALGLFIEYVDAHGTPSARRIACRYYDPSCDTITAWCFEREALREFRVDRIISAACCETGELFELGALVQSLRARGLPLRDQGLNLSLRLLTFIMRCDGVDHRELLVLEAAVTSYAMQFGGDDQMVDQGIRMAHSLAPDEGDFLRALRWLKMRRDRSALADFVRTQVRRMVDADTVLSHQEVSFGAEVDAVLRRIESRS
jgi:hypothetical protein